MKISDEITSRLPLIKDEHLKLFIKLKEHEHSPIWNYNCGDRINRNDLLEIDSFSSKLHNNRKQGSEIIPEEILHWVEETVEQVRLFKQNTKGISIRKDFSKIKCMTREDIATGLEKIIPENVSLERLIVNSTSGTSGHPIITPNHPMSIGCYTPLLLFALNRHGVYPLLTKDNVGCMLVCAQKETAVYSTVVPMLNGTGFAKINLHPSSWKKKESCQLFIEEFSPEFLTGDPFSFSEMMKIDLKYKPKALVSTSMVMQNVLRKSLIEKYDTKVIDYYSLNETGPIAYSCPINSEEFHVLPTDIFIEITNEFNHVVPENTIGEITVTGGRNPYIPLLRYKTGDRAKLKFDLCKCMDPMPRLYELETRKPVIFYNKKKQFVNPVDITRILKRYPILQYEFRQKKDYSCSLSIRKLHDFQHSELVNFRKELESVFQDEIDIRIDFNLLMDGRKSIAYETELS